MLLVILPAAVITIGLVEILGLPLVANVSDIITSFLSLSTMAGLMTAFDLSASRGLHTRRMSIPDGVCGGSGIPPSARSGLPWCSSSKELLVEEPSEGVSRTPEYRGYLEVVVLLLNVVTVDASDMGSGSDRLDPVDSVSEAEEE